LLPITVRKVGFAQWMTVWTQWKVDCLVVSGSASESPVPLGILKAHLVGMSLRGLSTVKVATCTLAQPYWMLSVLPVPSGLCFPPVNLATLLGSAAHSPSKPTPSPLRGLCPAQPSSKCWVCFESVPVEPLLIAPYVNTFSVPLCCELLEEGDSLIFLFLMPFGSSLGTWNILETKVH
jgi:hypothetical protein